MTAPAPPAPPSVFHPAEPPRLEQPGPLEQRPDPNVAAAAERTRIISRNVDITLADGRRLGMRYGMAGMVALEEAFGDLAGAAEAFGDIDRGRGRLFTTVAKLLACGLVHHGITYDDLVSDDLFDLQRISEYGDACRAAFELAFPSQAAASPGEADGQTTTG